MSRSSNQIISEIHYRVTKVSGNPPTHLHEPKLDKEDKKYLNTCTGSGFISSNGKFKFVLLGPLKLNILPSFLQ